jgi:glycosyltransferase involved in cell wall biosynthesis
MAQNQVLIITHDVVDENMAGPAIRCWEFARVLSREAQVTLATPHPTSLSPETFRLVQYDTAQLEAWASDSDVIILSTYTLWRFPFLRTLGIPLVADLYDPFLLETLPLLASEPEAERIRRHADILDALTDLLTWGDFFLCASERQRDYWLGWLNALDRINPATYDDDPTLRRLIDVVAFGLPSEPPQHTRPVLKGVHPGIAETDRVVLWAGGIYDWFDPLTLIRAMKRVSAQRDDAKLFFLGIHHPNPDVGSSQMAEQAVALSQELGLYDQIVFFNEWTPYDQRQNYLLEADVGASLHFAHLETHFSFRTRLLDHIWASLPTIVTRGDVLSNLVEEYHLGWVVDYENVGDVAAAILESTETPRSAFEERFAAVTPQLGWDAVMEPLLTFCRDPQHAADRQRVRSDLFSLTSLKLVSQINALRRDINARDERLTALGGVLRDREARIANHERALLVKEAEMASLRNELANLRTQFERAQQAKDAQIAHLQQAKDAQITHLQQAKDAQIAHLQQTIEEIEQGRVMRLLNGINHILKGNPLK